MQTVLVIEDDEEVGELLQLVLEGAGYRVLVAVDGLDGMVQAHVAHPDLVLSDIMLPVFDGFEVAHAIQFDPDLQTTPVVLMSAGLRPEPCQDGSWDAFLPKPFGIAQVVSVVAQHLHVA